MNYKQCFICKSWMDENQLVEGDDRFLRCYEHAYLNQETLITALREAGEKMAEALRHNKRVVDLGNPNDSWAFIDEDAAALEAWEAANK